MSREATYPTPWLDCRFPFDVRARHAATEAAALAGLSEKSSVRIVDLGCGHGANIRHFWNRISADQHWTLIDRDPQLLQAALAGMTEIGAGAGYMVERADPESLVLSKGARKIEVQTREGSLLDIAQLVDLSEVDLVMANAVFDLFSEDQTQAVLADIWPHTSILLTLNYTGMSFAPSHPDDARVIGWYETHMQRPQAFGQGMGADGPAFIEDWIQQQGGLYQFGTSIWEVLPQDGDMLRYLLGFMEEAIPELDLSADSLQVLHTWLEMRRKQLANGTLSCQVHHRDQWAQC